jgi:hypothetical protein
MNIRFAMRTVAMVCAAPCDKRAAVGAIHFARAAYVSGGANGKQNREEKNQLFSSVNGRDAGQPLLHRGSGQRE